MKISKKLFGIYAGPLGKILGSMDDDMGKVRFTGYAVLIAFLSGFLIAGAFI